MAEDAPAPPTPSPPPENHPLDRPLDRRVIFVTGATRGIGLAITHTLAAAGANIACGARGLHNAEALVRELTDTYGGTHLPIEIDVTKPPSVENMAEKLLKRYQRIDAIINNAGVMHMDQILDADVADFTETVGTNIGGPFLVTRALVSEMMLVRRGFIINISAMAGLGGAPFLSAYCASKAALISLTQSWAQELEEYNIGVYALCPDVVDTEMVRGILNVDNTPTLQPDAVAQRVLALLTHPDVESGSVIPMDAGAAPITAATEAPQ